MRKVILVLSIVLSLHGFACRPIVVPLGGSRFGDKCNGILGCLWLEYTKEVSVKILEHPAKEDLKDYREVVELLKIPKISTFRVKKGIDAKSLKDLYKIINEVKKCACKKEKILGIGCIKAKELVNEPQCIDWSDKKFMNRVHNKFSNLKNTVQTPRLSKQCVNIAIHYREGGTFDLLEDRKIRFKHKFLPLSFYVSGVKFILKKLPKNTPVFVGVFSDSVDQKFMAEIKKGLANIPNPNMVVKYVSNRKNYRYDFFYMSNFDFLVRGDSHFSLCAEKIGNVAGTYVFNPRRDEVPVFYWVTKTRQQDLMKRINASK